MSEVTEKLRPSKYQCFEPEPESYDESRPRKIKNHPNINPYKVALFLKS
jgi:hypothetical protein